MAQQPINTGGSLDDPTAESILSAFTKANAMTLELFTAFSLGGRLAIDLDASPDTIRAAFVKTNTNLAALYTAQSLPSVPVIDVGDAPDDVAADTIYAAFTTVNQAMTALYSATSPAVGDYYVATTGSDSNPGTLASPFRTIAKAYTVAVAGETIIVKAGVYVALTLNKSGTSSQRITLRSETPWGAVIDGGFNSANGSILLHITGAYNTIEGFVIRNSYQEGVFVGGASTILRNNHIHHNGRDYPPGGYAADGVVCNSAANDTRYEANYIHHNGRTSVVPNDRDHGLYITGTNVTVINNIITHNMTHGIQVRGGGPAVTNMLIANNVCAFNGQDGVMLYQAMNGVAIKNNILHKNSRYAVETYAASGSGVVIEKNITYANVLGQFNISGVSYTATGNLTSNPLFVNEASDYHVASGSPAIDAGLTLGAVPTDYAGVSRPQGAGSDIGAYERAP